MADFLRGDIYKTVTNKMKQGQTQKQGSNLINSKLVHKSKILKRT